MRVLAIETSCDETGVAIVEGEKTPEGFAFQVLGSALLSQAALHAPYGGVYPTLAKREHEKNLPVILAQALENVEKFLQKNSLAPLRPSGRMAETGRPEDFFLENFSVLGIDAIAVTRGPGLEPALWTGITFAQRLAKEAQLPLMGINHMEGHLVSSLVKNERLEAVQFPVLGLLISGGHTEFVLMRNWFDYHIVGETLDDAVGEAFDKVARLLGLPYPGGPEISKLADAMRRAEDSQSKRSGSLQHLGTEAARGPLRSEFSARLPRPMLQSKSCDMSFSGLKTAALYALRGKNLTDAERAAFAREFEDAVGDVFVAKTRRALQETGARTFVIGGGVAANRYLRERLQALALDEFPDVELRLPELSITGDNAVMIAEAALVHMIKEGAPTDSGADIRAVGNLSLNAQK